jgi:hypothetical protein
MSAHSTVRRCILAIDQAFFNTDFGGAIRLVTVPEVFAS